MQLWPQNRQWIAIALAAVSSYLAGATFALAQDSQEGSVKLQSESGAVWLQQAADAEKALDYSRAIDLYQRAAILPGTEEQGTVGAARAQAAMGDPEQAVKTLEAFLHSKNPFNVEAQLALTDLHLQASRLDLAEKQLRVTNRLRANYLPTYERYGVLNFLKGKYEISIRYLTPVLNRQPGNLKALALRAKAHFQLKHYPAALADFEALLESDPQNVSHMMIISRILIHFRKYAEVEKYVQRGLAAANGSTTDQFKMLLLAGQFEETRGDTQKAVGYLRKAFETNPADLALGLRIGEIYLSQDAAQDAEKVLGNLLRASTEDASALTLGVKIADFYTNKRKFNLASKILNHLLSGSPGNEPVAKRMVNLLTLAGHRDALGVFLKNYTDSHPEQTWATVEYARMLAEIDNPIAAMEALKKCVDKNGDPVNADVAVVYSSLLVKTQQIEEARDYLKKSLEKFATDDRLHFNLALCYEKLDKSDKAIREYAAVSEKDPNVYLKASINRSRLLQKDGKVNEALMILKKLHPENGELRSTLELAIQQLSSKTEVNRLPAGR